MTTTFDDETTTAFLAFKANDPLMKYTHEYSVVHYVGDVKGKSVLDLGCGYGHYTRMMKRLGASRVIGIDISQSMLDLATSEEQKNPLGVEYQRGDGRTLGSLGQFDVVLANAVLIFMETTEDLKNFVQTIHNNLKPGGKMVGFQMNGFSEKWYDKADKYGRKCVKVKDLPNGHVVKMTCDNDPKPLEVLHHYFDLSVYEKVFKEVGFQLFGPRNVIISEEAHEKFPKDFWKEFLLYPYIIFLEAIK